MFIVWLGNQVLKLGYPLAIIIGLIVFTSFLLGFMYNPGCTLLGLLLWSYVVYYLYRKHSHVN